MRVLVVDDNVAIREIVADILAVDGKEVSKAGTIREAVELLSSFRPDAVILDSDINGENGLSVLDELDSDSDIRAIVLTKANEILPKDNAFIYDFIQKPFKSDDLMGKVRSLEDELNIKRTKEKKFKFRLFSKHADQPVVEEDLPLRFGKSYVVFENEPYAVYRIARYFINKGCDVMVLTSEKIKTITERFKDQDKSVKIVGMSAKPRLGYIEMSRIGTIMDQVKRFISEHDKPVIVFDNLEDMIEINGLNNVVTMFYQVNHGVDKTSSLIVSTKDTKLTDKDKELFLHDMERFNIQDIEERS